jgi:acyl-coenzyme A thioesterase PaaI-like protein
MAHGTARRDAAQGGRLLAAWRRLAPLPGGRWLFSRIVGRMAPYTGTIHARVSHLAPGRAVVLMRDRKRVRNHLRSVHAIALANLGELASGLAATTAMPAGVRGIPVSIRVEYVRKARGPLTAIGSADLADVGPGEHADADAYAEIRDAADDVVATIHVTWRLEHVAATP